METVATISHGLFPRRVDFIYMCTLFIYLFVAVIWDSFFLFSLPAYAFSLLSAVTLISLLVVELMMLFSSLKTKTKSALIKEYLPLVGVVLIFGASSFLSSNGALLVTCAFVLTARHFSYDQIALTALIAVLSACAVIVLASLTGVIEDYVWVQRNGERVRHGLGFRYTTYLSHYLFFSFLSYVYLRRGKVGVGAALITLIGAATVFIFTNSRNSFFLTLAVLLVAMLWDKICPLWDKVAYSSGKIAVLIKGISYWLLPVLCSVSVLLMVIYSPANPVLNELNKILGSRLSISHNSYETYGVTLFGQYVDFFSNGVRSSGLVRDSGQPVTFIDNSYCNILVNLGLLVLIVFVGALTLLMRKAFNNRNLLIVIIVAMVALHSVIDPWLLAIRYDVPMLLIGTYLLGSDEWADKEDNPYKNTRRSLSSRKSE